MVIKKVTFDIGNVLFHVDIERFLIFLVQSGIFTNKEVAFDFLVGIQPSEDLGLYNFRRGLSLFNNKLDKKLIQEAHALWVDIIKPSEEMILFVEELITDGWQVALLSNIGYDHAAAVRESCKIFSKCEQFFSCEVGVRKPSKLYFQTFQSQYKWPKDVKFFDDRLENVEVSREYFDSQLFDLQKFTNDGQAVKFLKDALISSL
jgi:FMN phosphatase YigB (HAD superfamily)